MRLGSGLGARHANLNRLSVPLPEGTHGVQEDSRLLSTQVAVLHVSKSREQPTQSRPPGAWGGGLSQRRVRVRNPPPHLTEHSDQALQLPHEPSRTGTVNAGNSQYK